jgi:serine/threonine protein kinase
MRKYRCSLKEWRSRQELPLAQALPLYVSVYAQVLDALALLRSQSTAPSVSVSLLVVAHAAPDVVHFDIKAENILLEPLDELVSDSEFTHPSAPDALPFVVCLADFGESEVFSADGDMYSGRNRGTEPIKSPEMLTLAWLGACLSWTL